MHPITSRRSPASAIVVASLICTAGAAVGFGAGPLNPPVGPVAPTAKPIAEVEPRTAINAANTPGDADSLFRITQPGSYYLTGNETGVAGKSGIEVAVDNVSIDLNGFTLTGVTGSLAGVTTSISTATRLNNGTVQGWEDDGVRLSDFAVVTRVTTRDNVGGGINVGQSAVVTDCIAEGNDEQGFVANAGSALTSCVARNNTLDGFVLNACTVTGCTARVNGGSGFALQTAGVLSSCSGSSNSDNGATIATSGAFSSLVVDCAFSSNGADGISVSGNSTIRGCTLTGNGTGAATGAGLRIAGSDCRIEGNHCTDNERGILASAAGNFIVRNTCAGNTTNWELVANNVVGPIVDRTAPASAAILGNAAPSSLGTTDPNANFSY